MSAKSVVLQHAAGEICPLSPGERARVRVGLAGYFYTRNRVRDLTLTLP